MARCNLGFRSFSFQQKAAKRVLLASALLLALLALPGMAHAQAFAPGQTTFGPTPVNPATPPVAVVTLTAQASGSPGTPSVLTEGTPTLALSEFNLVNSGTCGSMSTLTQGQTCTVSVSFLPRFPGMRHGAVVLQTSAGVVLASKLLSGVGQGSLPVLIPAQISTVAGDENWYYQGDNVPATQANIYLPSGLAVDGAGNLFIADTVNYRVRRVDAATQLISTVVGNGNPGSNGDNGPATSAELSSPSGLALDGAGNLFIADTGNNTIRRVDKNTGIITTVAGTPTVASYTGDGSAATSATLNSPQAVALTPGGDLVIADTGNNAIRVVTASDGKIQTIAGTGPHNGGYNGDGIPAVTAQLNQPFGVAVRSDGAIAIADLGNNLVRLISTSGSISSIAGDQTGSYGGDGGLATSAQLNGPAAVSFDPAGDLLIADSLNNCVRLVYGAQGTIITLMGKPDNDHFAGDGGPDNQATMHGPYGVLFDAQGNIWLSDHFNNRVRKVNGQLLSIQYPTMKVGKLSDAVAETMINAGNQPLTFTSPTLQQAALKSPATTCGQASVAPATLCNMAVQFAPTSVSNPPGTPIHGSVTWNTNAPNISPVDQLSGVVLSVEPTTVVITSSANPGLVSQAIILTATVNSAATAITGTVTFTEGSNTWCPNVALNANGVATCTIQSLSLGTHTFLANYSGDNDNAASQSPAFTETVKQQAALALSFASPAIVTTAVTLSVAASSNSGVPSGNVTFYDGATALATVPLQANGSASAASWASSAFTVGNHAISVAYAGDTSNIAETSPAQNLEIDQASTVTVLTSGNNNATVGTSIPLTANVFSNIGSNSGPAPSGSVQFFDGPTLLGTAPLTGNGTASFTTANLTPGNHSLTAVYNGNTDDAPSTSSPISQMVQQIGTITTAGADIDPSNAGATVHLSAIVSLSPGAAADGVLTGTVTFLDGNATLGNAPLNASGQATLAVNNFSVGNHPITAHFGGNTNYAPSTSASLAEIVQQTATATTLNSSSTTTLMGRAASFSASVASATGVPTGSIVFKDGASTFGSAPIDTHGNAAFTTSALSSGTHAVTAFYAGDANYLASTSNSVQQTVNLASTTLSLNGSANTIDAGLQLTFSSTLATPGLTPTGTLTLLDGTTPLGTLTVTNQGTFTFTSSQLGVGLHTLITSYSGDTNNLPAHSAAITVTVRQANTVTALVSNTNPLTQGQPLSLTATITADSPNLTGNVNFYDGANLLGSASVNATGVASLSPQNLPVGNHNLTAVYTGDINHRASTSAGLPELIVQPASVALSSAVNPSVSGQNVVFTAQVNGSPSPTGSVIFRDNGSSLATVPLSASAAATFATASLSVGTHVISVTYSGDGNFSTAAAQLTQTVINASTVASLTASANPATYGQPLAITATIASNGGLATGTVNFLDGGTVIGSAQLNSSGTATLSLSTLPPGPHILAAAYAGDGKASPSTSQPLAVVVKQLTTLAISTPVDPALTLSSISFTASISDPGAAPATGSVVFTEGPNVLGTIALDPAGHATLTLPQMTAGTHTITASYAGDGANFASQSPTYNQVIQVRSTTTTVTGTATDLSNPQQMTLIAVVRGDGSTPPGGTVSFTSGAVTLGAAPVDATGVASITVIFNTPTQQIVAAYPGDISYAASQSNATAITAGQPAQFTIQVSNTNITLVSHQRTTVAVTVASVKGFTDQIALGCLGLPYAATCTFDKSQLKLNPDGTVSASLVVDTGNPLGAGSTATAAVSRPHNLLLCFPPAGLLAFVLLGKARRKRLPSLLLLLLTLTVAGTVSGCSGLQMNGTPPGTYTFRVIGTGQGSNTTQAQTITLVVTQ